MKRILTYILVILSTILLSYSISGFASTLEIPGADIISENSILVTTTGTDATEITQSFGLKILGLLKIVISGFALIFMVMIGAYMVIFSENEERIKTQRRQIVYVLVAFLFLNIPGFVYDVLSPADAGGVTLVSDTWTLKMIWYQAGIPGFVGNIVAFFRVFAYGISILMFTWAFFRLILSAGDEERLKSARSRLIYSSLALIFLLFVDMWIRTVSGGNLAATIPGVAGILFKLAIYFAAPVAIFFIIYGAYYYITSAGDEERVKKGKSILVNTFIATLILLAAFSFLTELIQFRF